MTKTATPTDLLIVAVQDLHDAEEAWLERLPGLASKTSGGLADHIASERSLSRRQSDRLKTVAAQLGTSVEGPPNIWMRAILDDADRDARTIVEGPLRDIALTGAFRKGKQSERVSYETAIGLARGLDNGAAVEALTRSRDEEAEADAELAALLDNCFSRLNSRSA